LSYIFADRVGHRLFTRYIDRNGRRVQRVFDKYPFEIFIPGKRHDAMSLFGEPLSRIECTEVSELSDFVKNYSEATKVYGQTSPVHQWIAKEFPGPLEVKMENFRILNFDIEVEHSEGFPEPDQAKYEILSISMKQFGVDKKITLGLKPYQKKRDQDVYIQCRDERELLIRFIDEWRRVDPDIITGWNIDQFDIPYIVNRLTKILGEDEARKLSPFYKDTTKIFNTVKIGFGEETYSILGIQSYDYMNLYKKFQPQKLESYKLDFVGEYEGVGRKTDYSAWGNDLMRLYHEAFETFIVYNENDVWMIEALDNKLKFIQVAVSIAYMTHSRLAEALATVKPWDNYFYNLLLADGIQIPPSDVQAAEQIVGAFVKVPTVGKYKWVVSLDLTSLYPSIMQLCNMGPEVMVQRRLLEGEEALKIVEKILDRDTDFLAELEKRRSLGIVSAANGAAFSQERPGLLARGAKFAFEQRKIVKGQMIAMKKRKEAGEDVADEVARLDAGQQALKVLGNGLYGATANAAFRYFSRDVAEGITVTGQLIIRFISDKINAFLNEKFKTKDVEYAFYNDTDSCYITLDHFVTNILKVPPEKQGAKASMITDIIDKFIKDEIDPLLEREFNWLAETLGSKNNTLSMKREAIADAGIFRGRKNYILQVWDLEGVKYHEPVIKTVGVEAGRTSTPKIVRDELKSMFRVMLNEDNNTLLTAVDTFRKRFYNAKASEIAFPKGVSEIRGKTLETKGNPIHVRASLGFNELIRQHKLLGIYEPIKDGSKVKYVYLKLPNHLRQNVIAFTEELPEEFGLHSFIDYDTQFQKTFLDPLKSFTDIIGWEVEKRSTLDDLWE